MSNDRGGVSTSSATTLLDNTGISRHHNPLKTHFKVIGSGKIIEVYEFRCPINVGQSTNHYPKTNILSDDEIFNLLVNPELFSQSNKRRSVEYKKRNINRAKNKIRRLAQMNFDQVGKFLTLTFSDTDNFDIQSLDDCLPRFQRFIKKLRHIYPDLAYIAVPEYQDKNNRGAVHFHLINNLPYTPVKKIRKLWPHGFIKINRIDRPELVGPYMAKYLGKYAGDLRFHGHRAFYASSNLKLPVTRYGDQLKQIINAIEAYGFIPTFTSTYTSDWSGEISYKSYNLYQRPAKKENRE